MKEYLCVEVMHHKDIAEKIDEMQKSGWKFHTYQVTGIGIGISHYLLFERKKS